MKTRNELSVRVVEVRSKGSEPNKSYIHSGFLISPELILTAAHDFSSNCAHLAVRLGDGAGYIHDGMLEIVWCDNTLDVLLLRAPVPLVNTFTPRHCQDLELNRPHEAQVWGYPKARVDGEVSAPWSAKGWLRPAPDLRAGTVLFQAKDDFSEAWAAWQWGGASGGPVFVEDGLFGIVLLAEYRLLHIRPMSVLWEKPGFADAIDRGWLSEGPWHRYLRETLIEPFRIGRSLTSMDKANADVVDEWDAGLDQHIKIPSTAHCADYYVPLDVCVCRRSSPRSGRISIEVALEREFAAAERRIREARVRRPNFGVVIVGEFGSGKTFVLEHLASRMATQYIERKSHLMPVFVSLREMLPARSIKSEVSLTSLGEQIGQHLTANLRANQIVPATIATSDIVWLLDGADEWVAGLGPLDARECVKSLLHPLQLGGQPRILTSRPETMDRLFDWAPSMSLVRMDLQPLTLAQKRMLVDKRAARNQSARSVANLIDELDRNAPECTQLGPGDRYYDLPSITKSPVVLAMLCSLGDDIDKLLDDGREVTTWNVYECYIAKAASREEQRQRRMLTPGLHMHLVESIAVFGAVRGTHFFSPADEDFRRFLLESVRSFIKHSLDADLDPGDDEKLKRFGDGKEDDGVLGREIADAYLLLPSGSKLTFLHRSLMEFFVARRVITELQGKASYAVPHVPSIQSAAERAPSPALLDAQRLSDGMVRFIADQVPPGSEEEKRLIGFIRSTRHRPRQGTEAIESGWLGGNALSILLFPGVQRSCLQQAIDMQKVVVKGGRFYGRGYDELGHLDLRGAYMVETDAPASIYVGNNILPAKAASKADQLRCMARHRGMLLVGLGDGRLGIFFSSLIASHEPGVLRASTNYVRSIATARTSNVSLIAFSDYDAIYVARIENRRAELICLVDDLGGEVHRIDAIWRDGRLVVAHGAPDPTGGDEGGRRPVVRLTTWSGERNGTVQPLSTAHSHGSSINSVRLHGPAGLLASGADDGFALVSRLADPISAPLKLTTARPGRERHGINEVCFSPDGQWLAAADGGGLLTVWDLHSGLHGGVAEMEPTAQAKCSRAPLFSVDWQLTSKPSPADRIVVGGREQAVHLFDLIRDMDTTLRRTTTSDGDVVVPYAHFDNVRCVRLGPTQIYSSGNDGFVNCWPIEAATNEGGRRSRTSVRPAEVVGEADPMQPIDLPYWAVTGFEE